MIEKKIMRAKYKIPGSIKLAYLSLDLTPATIQSVVIDKIPNMPAQLNNHFKRITTLLSSFKPNNTKTKYKKNTGINITATCMALAQTKETIEELVIAWKAVKKAQAEIDKE